MASVFCGFTLIGAACVAAALFASPLWASANPDELVWPASIEDLTQQLRAEDAEARRRAATDLIRLPASVKRRVLPGLFADPDPEIKLAVADAALSIRLREAAERVVAWLGDSDVRVREAAAEVLAVMRHPDSIAGLGRLLEDQVPSARIAAAAALGNSRASDASLLLMGHLDDNEPEVRSAVIAALEQLGDTRAVVPLIGRIQEPRATLRRQAVATLGALGDAKATSALLVALGDADASVRAAAATALGQLRAPEAVWSLESLLDTESDEQVVSAVLRALGELATPTAINAILAAAEHPRAPREAVEAAMVRAGSAALPGLERCVIESAPARSKRICVAVLGELGGEVPSRVLEQSLRQGLVEPAAALAALGQAGDARALPTILEYLSSTTPAERRVAVDALGELLEPERHDGLSVEPLGAALQRARGARLEQAALIGLLGRTGSPRAAPHLLPWARSSDEYLRATAIEALSQLGPSGADAVLLDALDSRSFATRWTAALALSKVGSKSALEPLLARLEQAPSDAREIAAIALGGPLSAGADAAQLKRLERWLEHNLGPQKDALIEALARLPGDAGVALLGKRISLSGRATRAKIAEVLGTAASSRELLRRLAKDAEATVRANAAWSLGSVGTAADLALLAQLIDDRDAAVASNAVAALARVSRRAGVAAGPALCEALADERSYVRANALTGSRLTSQPCPGPESAEWLLEQHPSEEVRLAAARLIAEQPTAAEDAQRSLRSCASRDPSGRVAAACTKGSSSGDTGAAAPSRPVQVWVVPAGSGSPAAHSPFALVRSDGLIRCGLADRRGAVLEPQAPPGELRLAVPVVFAD